MKLKLIKGNPNADNCTWYTEKPRIHNNPAEYLIYMIDSAETSNHWLPALEYGFEELPGGTYQGTARRAVRLYNQHAEEFGIGMVHNKLAELPALYRARFWIENRNKVLLANPRLAQVDSLCDNKSLDAALIRNTVEEIFLRYIKLDGPDSAA